MPAKARYLNAVFPSLQNPYICPSCSRRRSIWLQSGLPKQQNLTAPRHELQPFTRRVRREKREVSTPASVTAINVPRNTPAPFRRLDEALNRLERDAAVYINSSQIQLVKRGVQSEDAITRIAVLGLNTRDAAARLVRALLADPLAPEPEWERAVTEGEEIDRRALLLRYNEKASIDDHHPLIKTILAPSSILHQHNLEILIHSIDGSSYASGASSLLVPYVDIPNSAGGRTSTVTYPVHKSLVYSGNLETAVESGLASILRRSEGDSAPMVKTVIDGPWNNVLSTTGQTTSTNPINLSLAEVGIEKFRKSLENSIDFEHAWFDGGMPSIASWLVDGSNAPEGTLKASIYDLADLVTKEGLVSIHLEESLKLREVDAASITTADRDVLNQGASIWAENAHNELRDRLDGAFVSKSWAKTRWWKLLWRIDEVEYITTDIVRRAWLVDAEKEMIWMSGRVHQSGLLGPPKLRPPPQKLDPEDEVTGILGRPTSVSVTDLVDNATPFDSSHYSDITFKPWPQDIHLARLALARTTIPPMQALGQKLLLQAVSVSFLTSALSVLTYVSVSAASVFEAGAIAALGLAFSLRRLQKRWEGARSVWQATLREQGKDVLRRAEGQLREVIRDGGRVGMDEAETEQRRAAKKAIDDVRLALKELRSPKP